MENAAITVVINLLWRIQPDLGLELLAAATIRVRGNGNLFGAAIAQAGDIKTLMACFFLKPVSGKIIEISECTSEDSS